MYDEFHAVDRWTGERVHCRYQALIVAIATRHADAVDIKFLVDERPVWIALLMSHGWNTTGKREKSFPTHGRADCRALFEVGD